LNAITIILIRHWINVLCPNICVTNNSSV